MHRAGSGVIGATDGSELHERSTRSNGTSPSPVRPFLSFCLATASPVSTSVNGATLMFSQRALHACLSRAG